MGFTIGMDISWLTDTLNTIQFFNVSFILGSILGLILCYLISNDMHHFKINFFPTIVLLHLMGLYQNIIIIIIASFIFVLETFSFKMLGQTFENVATFASETYSKTREVTSHVNLRRKGLSSAEANFALESRAQAKANANNNLRQKLIAESLNSLTGQNKNEIRGSQNFNSLSLPTNNPLLQYIQPDLNKLDYETKIAELKTKPFVKLANMNSKRSKETQDFIKNRDKKQKKKQYAMKESILQHDKRVDKRSLAFAQPQFMQRR